MKPMLTDHDIYLFKEGSHFKLYEKLGAHPMVLDGVAGARFGVWAPNARSVSVIGDFNGWDRRAHPLTSRWDSSGVWEGFVPGVAKGGLYKFYIVSNNDFYQVEKQDPFAFFNEAAPKTASVVWDLSYSWGDGQWMAQRHSRNSLAAPMSIYEVHIGSWKRVVEEGNRSFSYRELARHLVPYLK